MINPYLQLLSFITAFLAVIFWFWSAVIRIPDLPQTMIMGPESVTGIMKKQSRLNGIAAGLTGVSVAAQAALHHAAALTLGSDIVYRIDWKLILEYLKVFLSWPPIVFCLVIIMTCRFKSQVPGLWIAFLNWLSSRNATFNIGPGGLSLQVEATKEEAAASKAAPTAGEENYEKLYHFERGYNLIFGSQIQLLESLQNQPGKSDHLARLQSFYTAHFIRVNALSLTPTTFNVYLNFLSVFRFLSVDNAAMVGTLTSFGQEFLDYIKLKYPSYPAKGL